MVEGSREIIIPKETNSELGLVPEGNLHIRSVICSVQRNQCPKSNKNEQADTGELKEDEGDLNWLSTWSYCTELSIFTVNINSDLPHISIVKCSGSGRGWRFAAGWRA